jgi:hypothetical protein
MSKVHNGSFRATRIGACLAGLMMLVSTTAGAEDEAAPDDNSVSYCISFEQNTVDNGMEYRVTNSCERRVTCTVSWTLYCGDSPPLRRIPGRITMVVPSTEDASTTATAASCAPLEGWHIANSTWECKS